MRQRENSVFMDGDPFRIDNRPPQCRNIESIRESIERIPPIRRLIDDALQEIPIQFRDVDKSIRQGIYLGRMPEIRFLIVLVPVCADVSTDFAGAGVGGQEFARGYLFWGDGAEVKPA